MFVFVFVFLSMLASCVDVVSSNVLERCVDFSLCLRFLTCVCADDSYMYSTYIAYCILRIGRDVRTSESHL